MDLADEAEHLLGDPPVIRVALGRRPELAQVVDLAKVEAEVPPDVEGEWHDVLCQARPGVALHPGVGRCRCLDRGSSPAVHPKLGQADWQVVAERSAEQLAVLSEHPMPVQVAVRGEVGDDLERVLGVLEGSRRALPAIATVAEHRFEEGGGIAFELLPACVRQREEGGGDHLALSVGIVLEQGDAWARPATAATGSHSRRLQTNPRYPLRRGSAIALVESPLHKGGNDEVELALQVCGEAATFRQLVACHLRDQVLKGATVAVQAEVRERPRRQQAAQHVKRLSPRR